MRTRKSVLYRTLGLLPAHHKSYQLSNHFQISYFSCGACPRDKCPSSCRMRCRYCKGVCEGQVSNPYFVRHDWIDSHWILEMCLQPGKRVGLHKSNENILPKKFFPKTMCLHPGKRVGQLSPVGAKCYINNWDHNRVGLFLAIANKSILNGKKKTRPGSSVRAVPI